MKRSLVSLAVLAAVSEAHRNSSVTLFGRVDLTEPRPPERIRLQPPSEFWLQADLGEPSYASNVLVMPAKQIGKTATFGPPRVERAPFQMLPWQEDAIADMKASAFAHFQWP